MGHVHYAAIQIFQVQECVLHCTYSLFCLVRCPTYFTKDVIDPPPTPVILVRFSPKDAPGAYWSMTSTAFSLIITSFVTSATGAITLLDAIVVVYGQSCHLFFSSGFCFSTIVPKYSAVSANSSIGFWIIRNRRPRRQDDSFTLGAFPSSHCCQLDTFSPHVFFRFVCLDISTYLWVRPIRMQRSNEAYFLWSEPTCIRLWQIPQPHYLGCFDTAILLPNAEKLYHDLDCRSSIVLLHGQSSATQTKRTSQE